MREVWRRVRNLDYSRPAKPQLLLFFRHCISFVLFVSHTIFLIKQTLNKWSIPDAHSLDLRFIEFGGNNLMYFLHW